MKTRTMKRGVWFGFGLGAAGLVAVAGVVASVTMGMGEKPAAAPALNAGEFKIDGVHSAAIFKVQHLGVSQSYGRFNTIEGSFLIDKDKPEASSINVTIPIDSVDTNNASRDKHLKSPDFFSAKEFAKMSFVSKSVKKNADGTFEVAGDFMLRGQTKPLTVTVKDGGIGKGMKGGEVAGFETTFSFKRSDYGMAFMVGPVGEEVVVTIALEGARS